jgi:outer membrane protein
VDLAKIGTDSEPGKAGQTKLINQKKKLQAQIESKRKQLDKQRAEIEAKLSSLTQDQREAKSNEFRKKIDEFQKFGQKSENELQKMQMELSNSLYEKIQKATNAYAKINILTLVVVKREILYQSAGVVPQDITDEVIKLVNEEGRKK